MQKLVSYPFYNTLQVWFKIERISKQNIWNAEIFGLNNLLEVLDRKYILWKLWSY